MQLLYSPVFLLLSFLILALPLFSLAAFQNVTTLLDSHPDYSSFNRLLSQYGVAPQINSRTTITVFCPPNHVVDAFMSAQGSMLDRQSLFNILSYHVLLDYEDPEKLRTLAGGFATITTLFQTTGLAAGQDGFMNITVSGGVAKIRRPGTNSFATIGSSLEQFPFNISLLAVDEVLVPAGIGGPAPPPVNITQIISQAGNFSNFVSALVSTGVDKVLQSHDTPPGVTIFAPTNAAFDRLGSDAVNRLTSAQLVALMEFHALNSFYPTEELATASGPQATLASGSGGGAFTVTMSQDKAGIITINAGANKVPIAGTLYSNNPVAVFVVDSVLLPTEIFGAMAPSPTKPSPSPSPVSSTPMPMPTPTPSSTAPSHAPLSSASTPSPLPTPAAPSPTPVAPASEPASAPTSPPAPLLGPDYLTPASGPGASSPESPTSSSDIILYSPFSTCMLGIAFFLFLI